MPEKYYEKALGKLKEKRKIPAGLSEEVRRQAKMKASILKALSGGPKTVPQIAEEIHSDPSLVLWFIAALRRYGQVTESGKDGDYHKYARK